MTLLTLVSLFPASLAAQPFSAKPGNTIPSGHHAAGLRSAQLVRTPRRQRQPELGRKDRPALHRSGGTHPSSAGAAKVTAMLMKSFLNSPHTA